MIITSKDIYNKVAIKNNIPLELIESIGKIVFEEMRAKLDEPKELAYELPGIGTFNLRFAKFETFYNIHLKRMQEEDVSEKTKNNDKNLTNLYNKIQEYREDKKAIKEIRNEQNKSIESSEDN